MLEGALKRLEEKEEAIQRMLELERLTVREASRAISLFTVFDKQGKAHVEKAEEYFAVLRSFPYREDVKTAVEGEIVEAKVVGQELLALDYKINIHSPEAQVYGVLDAIGELKRAFLKLIIKGDVRKAEKLLERMEALYREVEGVVFTNATLSGFRKKRDSARYALESAMEILARISR